MSETTDVLEALAESRARGRPAALATIVGVRGSTYRRPGARLLVYDRGPSLGNLSGGCLEGEVEDVARAVMGGEPARTVTYDLTADDEAIWGWGLGCNGVIEVFVEPADAAAHLAAAMAAAIEQERPVAVATALAPEDVAGGRVLVHPDGSTEGSSGDDALDELLARLAAEGLASGGTRTVEASLHDRSVRVFVEVLEPPPRLLVCGAGHDAIAVVRTVAQMGWRAVVVDDRADLLNPERFPQAHGFVHCQPEEVAGAAVVDDRTHAVVMTHNFLRDRAYLRALLDSPAAYIGMLGPSARLQRLLDGLAEEGVRPSAESLARVHGPAGLDVGAEGPDEIAVALAAELLAVHNGRAGGFLRDRSGPIHDRAEVQAVARG